MLWNFHSAKVVGGQTRIDLRLWPPGRLRRWRWCSGAPRWSRTRAGRWLAAFAEFRNTWTTRFEPDGKVTCINESWRWTQSNLCKRPLLSNNGSNLIEKLLALKKVEDEYSQTCVSDHLWPTTTCEQRQAWTSTNQEDYSFYRTTSE